MQLLIRSVGNDHMIKAYVLCRQGRAKLSSGKLKLELLIGQIGLSLSCNVTQGVPSLPLDTQCEYQLQQHRSC